MCVYCVVCMNKNRHAGIQMLFVTRMGVCVYIYIYMYVYIYVYIYIVCMNEHVQVVLGKILCIQELQLFAWV